jgi:hypothetical protein
MRKLLFLLTLFSALAAAASAYAQFSGMRYLPPQGVRGVLGPLQQYPAVVIGKTTLRLTPGARIYDRNNRTLLHQELPPGAEILFLRDQAGDVVRIYVLTEQELVLLKQLGRK